MRTHYGRALLATGWLIVCASLVGGGCRARQEAAAPSGDAATGATAPTAEASRAFDQPRKASGPIRLRIITNGDSPFWEPMRRGMEEVRDELQCEAIRQAPARSEHIAQKAIFEAAIAAGVDGIAVSPIEADAFASVIDQAIDAGIPVLTFDSDSARSQRLVYIGTNNYEAGRVAGKEAVRLLPNGGRMVAFVGTMSAQNARDRYRGFLDAIQGHGIEMLQAPFEDDQDKARAQRNVADAITRYGDQIDGFLGLYSYNGPAIAAEVTRAGIRSRVKIVCFDGEPLTLSNLERGLVDVAVVQKPYQFGRLCTRLLYLINRRGLPAALEAMKPELDALGMRVQDGVIDTGVEVITPANAGPFIQRLREKGLEST
ncbi:MAG TPA: sugar-binding protein [Chthonomonadales bacterium]|nr:sugar-binding protein [Chthonomonadales bacterium]